MDFSPRKKIEKLIRKSTNTHTKKYWKRFLVGVDLLDVFEGEFYLSRKLMYELFGEDTFKKDKEGNKKMGYILFDELYEQVHKGNNIDGVGCSRYVKK